jgi:single-strand DNA-binding protein
MLNHVTLIGNLGAAERIRVGATSDGTVMARFSLATERYFATAQGTQRRTDWHVVVAFGPIADTVRRYASEGRRVLVEGYLERHTFTGQDGQNRADVRVVAEAFRFLDPRPAEVEERIPVADLGTEALPPEATVPPAVAPAPAPAPQPVAPPVQAPPSYAPAQRWVRQAVAQPDADRPLVLEDLPPAAVGPYVPPTPPSVADTQPTGFARLFRRAR